MNLKRFFGNKAFYKATLALALPIILQNGITNFVGLLDNVMVGRLGTEQLSGVAIANQLLFVFNLCIYGAVAGAGIFGAQFYGKHDNEGIRNVLRIKFICAVFICVITHLIFVFFGDNLILLFLHEGGETGNLDLTLHYGREYLKWCQLLLLPFALVQTYSSTLRETGHPVPPMRAGFIAFFVNLFFNWILIFGNLGFPKLGVAGAALATVLSRLVELIVVATWTHSHTEENPFIVGFFSSFRIEKGLFPKVMTKTVPLTVNELFWSGGMTFLNQCYSMYGISTVAATSISSTIVNVFNIVLISIGNCVGIMVGNQLGANDLEEAVDTDRKLVVFSALCCTTVACILFITAPIFPRFYNTTQDVKNLSTSFLRITAAFMVFHSVTNCTYFTMRAGGKTLITTLFDSGYMWLVIIPIAFYISRFTKLPVEQLYMIVELPNIIKAVIGIIMIKSRIWVRNFVQNI